VGAVTRGENVLEKIALVDLGPDPPSDRHRLVVAQVRIAVEVRHGVAKRRPPESEEALDVPRPNIGEVGVDIDRDVEEVGGEDARRLALCPPTG